ncbi:hypothetical protein CASFOL_042152 [Castilleja foliolosa]|uniref:2-isopropylmalate synthase/homocitrate synthase post-catalytic domain-containing protein n=1 Tax=Castilleja foliolosa TaxID=1961234 RepID=A0ABD3B9N3_9LAMI
MSRIANIIWSVHMDQYATHYYGQQDESGLRVQPHKAIVGANAFAHESGLHQDGMLKHKNTYTIISPEDIGLQRSSESGIVLGKLRASLS